MDPRDSTRTALTDALLEKLYNCGAVPTRKSLALCDKLSTSSFCRCGAKRQAHAACRVMGSATVASY